MTTSRSALSKAITFARFARQQRKTSNSNRPAVAAVDDADLILNGGETEWLSTSFIATKGQPFVVHASGANIVSKGLNLFLEPKATLWLRIDGKAPIRKVLFNGETVFEAWASGKVEAFTKLLSEWSDESGAVFPGTRKRASGGIGIRITSTTSECSLPREPDQWKYMWRLGDGTIFKGDQNNISINTDRDVGILCTDIDVPLTEQTVLSWSWLINQLPSNLPEDLALTHDYISIAAEFDNGQDLTYLWSKELPAGHHFACPLNWWCDRETHWVVRSGENDLGLWQHEARPLLYDYRKAVRGPVPTRVVRIWLIANSIFQHIPGQAQFRDIEIKETGNSDISPRETKYKCDGV